MKAPKKKSTPPTPNTKPAATRRTAAATPMLDEASDQYDELMIALEQADSLAYHLVDRLADLSANEAAEGSDQTELYALSTIARAITDKHQVILEKGTALLGFFKDKKGDR